MTQHFLKLTIPVHILLVMSLFVVDWTLWNGVWIFLLWLLIGGFGVAVGYHRYFAHRSFQTNPIIAKILAYLGLLSGDGSLIFWVALHIGLHHKYSDKEQDLHSPSKGIWSAFIAWQRNINQTSISLLSARSLLKDRYYVFLHEYYYLIYWTTFFILCCINWSFALGVFIPASILSHHQDNLVNVVGHLKSTGYRNFNINDNSVNNWFTGLFVWGQGWHNNHHAKPNDSNFGGRKWWEFDSAHSLLIPLIRKKNENST